MLSILCVRLMIKVKVGIPESFKVGWYPPKKTRSSHLNKVDNTLAKGLRHWRTGRRRNDRKLIGHLGGRGSWLETF